MDSDSIRAFLGVLLALRSQLPKGSWEILKMCELSDGDLEAHLDSDPWLSVTSPRIEDIVLMSQSKPLLSSVIALLEHFDAHGLVFEVSERTRRHYIRRNDLRGLLGCVPARTPKDEGAPVVCTMNSAALMAHMARWDRKTSDRWIYSEEKRDHYGGASHFLTSDGTGYVDTDDSATILYIERLQIILNLYIDMLSAVSDEVPLAPSLLEILDRSRRVRGG